MFVQFKTGIWSSVQRSNNEKYMGFSKCLQVLNFYWKDQYDLMLISPSKNYVFLVCPLKMARVRITPAIMKIYLEPKLWCIIPFSTRRNKSFQNKWLIPDLWQEMYKISLEYSCQTREQGRHQTLLGLCQKDSGEVEFEFNLKKLPRATERVI